MALVELKAVRKSYALGETMIDAVRGVDLEINTHEFVAVWGPSGSGKSTLCHLMGIIDRPTSGSVSFQGQDVVSLSDDRQSELRNHSIGFIFQSFNLVPVLTALENVMLPLQVRGESKADAMEKAMMRLREANIDSHAHHRPKKLSGGQQQRVAIARALVTDPLLVIADEPTANLDSVTAHRILDLMREVNHTRGTAFVFSTHDQRLLDRVTRQIKLSDGLITEDIIVTA
ncbi:MAG: ABC transporter ATP-binding protein [Chthoniobacteraceae bacterium]